MQGLEELKQETTSRVLEVPSDFREYYTTLRDRLMLAYGSGEKAPRLMAITGCQGGEGVTTVALHLAVSMANQCRILLVDADLEAPSMILKVREEYLPEFPSPPEGEEGVLARVAKNLDVLSACRLEGEDRRKFESPTLLSGLIEQYRRLYDYVLFDTPPVNAGSAALRFGSQVDGVVLVLEAERTLLEAARRAKEQLAQVKARVLGAVLNKRTWPIPKPLYRK
ncbi:MAG: CpsD/CapB family tyrosine-protein kinase [Planctomycetota bacterium]|jgi:Mrp family chromosome partitioning ATPase